MQWWRGLVLVPGHWSEGGDGLWCQPIVPGHQWSPPPAINLSLTTWSPEWDVPGEVSLSPDVHICCGAHWADTVIPSLIYCHRSRGCSNIRTSSPCYAYCLRPIYSVCANFIFSQFAPIAITAWGRVMWTAISELLCCYWSGPGRETTQHPPINWSQTRAERSWKEWENGTNQTSMPVQLSILRF